MARARIANFDDAINVLVKLEMLVAQAASVDNDLKNGLKTPSSQTSEQLSDSSNISCHSKDSIRTSESLFTMSLTGRVQ